MTGGKYGRFNGARDEELLKFGERLRPMAPEKFAERALRAVLRGDVIIVVPALWKAWWYLERLSPALSMRFAKVMLKRIRELESTTSLSLRALRMGAPVHTSRGGGTVGNPAARHTGMRFDVAAFGRFET